MQRHLSLHFFVILKHSGTQAQLPVEVVILLVHVQLYNLWLSCQNIIEVKLTNITILS